MTDYFVRTTGGSDGNTGLSVAQGWNTIGNAASSVAAGDRVFLCVMADGETFDGESYPVNFTIPGDTTTGMIQWSGANSSGEADGTVATIDAGSSGDVVNVTATGDRNYFQYISVINGTRGWEVISGALYVTMFRCEAHDNSSDGFVWTGGTANGSLVECLSEGNGSRGYFMAGTEMFLSDCVAKDNANQGVDAASSITSTNSLRMACVRCLSYNSDGSTSQNNGFRRPKVMLNCVAYNNTQDGKEMDDAQLGRIPIVLDSLFVNNGEYGIADNAAQGLFLNNAFHNNTSGNFESDPLTVAIEENTLNLEGDPFNNAANNDFTLNGDRAGLLARREIHQGPWIKRPANIIWNGGFDDDTNWNVGGVGNWSVANGVAHHSPGSNVQLEWDTGFVGDGIVYETIYTIKNYVQGSCAIKVGNTQGTTRSSNGTFREILVGSNFQAIGIDFKLAIVPNDASPAQFEADIDDVFVAPLYSGPRGRKVYGNTSRMTSYGARGVARTGDRRITAG